MLLLDFLPSLPLRAHVRTYRLIHFTFANADVIPYKPYPPRPEHTLSFYPRDREAVQYEGQPDKITCRSALVGQHDVVNNRYVGKDFTVIQVVFQPGALFRLTGIPAGELNNRYLDAETIFSKDIREVNARLGSAVDHKEMMGIIECFLLQLVNRSKVESHSIDQVGLIMLKNKEVSVDWLARESCLSTRQFERKFIERTGITPKYFMRVARFAEAYKMKNSSPEKDWLSIAIDCGYYDYQHLAKDYNQFTKQSPIAFHLLDMKAPERTFGGSDQF
ncbi:MAG TPA: helix-turn-helix domain-containing protein [Cyclobacteriaceae bacterium]